MTSWWQVQTAGAKEYGLNIGRRKRKFPNALSDRATKHGHMR